MRLFSIRGTSIVCSPLLLVLVLAMILAGKLTALLTNLLALMLHEFAHALMAKALGCEVTALEMQPFGFVARLGPTADRWDELCIAAAGPLFSLLAGLSCLAIGTQNAFILDFGYQHISIAILNLLPALPLDGGRILSAGLFLSGFGVQIILRLSFVIAALLLALGVLLAISGNPTLLILALFLLMAAFQEQQLRGEKRLGAYLHRRERLSKGRSLPVRMVALPASATIGEALRSLGGDRYTVVLVVDTELRTLFSIDEGSLMEMTAREGYQVRLIDCGKIATIATPPR